MRVWTFTLWRCFDASTSVCNCTLMPSMASKRRFKATFVPCVDAEGPSTWVEQRQKLTDPRVDGTDTVSVLRLPCLIACYDQVVIALSEALQADRCRER
jgi:hypothetical protein